MNETPVSQDLCHARMKPLYEDVKTIKSTLNAVAIGVIFNLAGIIAMLLGMVLK